MSLNLQPSSVDLGPLSWVKTEIEHSLAEARSNLDKLALDITDAKALKRVVTHLHQVTGALSMVGLGAATRFTEEIESVVAALDDPAASADVKQRVILAKQATGALSSYLDSLMAGEPDRPMALATAYMALSRGRATADTTESDLFAPDLTVAVPMPEDTVALPRADMLTDAIKQRRSLYQAGLLKLLREKDLAGGARDMRNATLAIEALQVTSPTRAFWFTVSGFFDAVVTNPAESGTLAVQLLGKIDQQIKMLIDGVQKVPERLFRDLLLVIGKSTADTERTRAIRAIYRLDELLAAAPERDAASDESVRTLVRSLRDQIQATKDNWLKFTSGNRSALDAFAQQGEALSKAAQPLSNAGMVELLRVLGLVGPHLKKTGQPPTEVQALEVASAILFVEASLENFFRLSNEFSQQSQAVITRIKAAMSGAALPAADGLTGAMMDDFSKRAQERLLMFQVGQEVQVNLSTIESTLDTFFRDPVKTADLATLPPLFSQVHGALAILELDEAAALNQMLRERVSQFASGALKGVGDDAETVAEGVSALGLFVSALQQSSTDSRSLLLPALIRFGLVEKPVAAEGSALKSPISTADVELDKQKVQALYSDWKQQSEDSSTREQLRDAVLELKQDAEVAGDAGAVKSSDATLQAIGATFDPLKTSVTQAIAEIAPVKVAETPTAHAVQLLDAPTAEIDQELLDIFLEEATEVVATIRESLELVRQSSGDREALTTIRRSFHTLKGSGRMVGLTDLGEVAWGCEQVFNKWLKEGKPLTPGLLMLISDAASAFSTWVLVLQASGTAAIDGGRLANLCELLKNDKEPPAEPVAAISEPAASASVNAGALSFASEEAIAPVAEFEAIDGDAISQTEAIASDATPPLEDIFAELPALTGAHSAVATEPLVEAAEDEMEIGPIKLPMPLFEIYLGEAGAHVEALSREMAVIEANSAGSVSHEFMRAAHTLTSSSRTTGFQSIAEVAFALEKWLQDAIELMPAWNEERIAVTRQSVDAIADMVLALHTHAYPAPRHDVVTALTVLRDALQADARVGEATSLKKPLTGVQAPLRDSTMPLEVDAEPWEFDAALPDVAVPDAIEDIFANDPAEPVLSAPTAELVPEAASTSALVAAASAFAATEPPAEPAAESLDDRQDTSDDDVLPPLSFEATETVEAPIVLATPADAAVVDEFAEIVPESTVEATASPARVATAAQPEAFESGKDRRGVKDDVDTDLLPIFLDEAREIIPQVGDALRRWRAAPENHAPVAELARHFHTLKGSARMAGLMRLGELSHVMETRAIDMDRVAEPKAVDFDALDDRLDRFSGAIESLAAGDLSPIIEIPIESDVAATVAAGLPSPLAAIAAARAEIVAQGEKLEGRERQALLRVNADLIDRFVNEAGELAIARSRVDLELQAFKKAMLELNDNIGRMKVQLRELEIGAESQIQSRTKEAETLGEQFDPLEFDRFSRMQELTRFMAESLNDVVTLQQSLAKNLDEADSALLQQGRLNRDLQQGLMGVRLVPLGNLQDRFYRLVRQTAKELEKKVNLEFRGARVEIDRSVLEKITAPLEHLLRNAVAHGLESTADRAAKGKPEIGEISIDAKQLGNEVILTLADDGGGLNFKRIRETAIARGMAEAGAELSEAQLTQFIFASGFSTAATVSQISGRGVGMDVVRSEIVSLGGRIDIMSARGKGTTFTITLPLTLAVTQAVMVIVGETTYAIPSVMIEQVQEYKGKRYEPLLELNEIEWKSNRYPLRSMEVILGGKPKVSAQRRAFVILAKSGQQRAAVQVDDIIGNREIVVKSIGPQLARIPGIAGATVLGSGKVVLIMNPVQLVFREATSIVVEPAGAPTSIGAPFGTAEGSITMSTEAVREILVPSGPSLAQAIASTVDDSGFMADEAKLLVRANPLVMVVDDSLTVRKITSRMLTRERFEVATAKDGVDGLQQLQDLEPDLILLDIEMPRMDGFEFARNVRADAKTKHIPIIMITSRTADKHRNRALELGVNAYMGKPYQEEQLLQMIREFTNRSTA